MRCIFRSLKRCPRQLGLIGLTWALYCGAVVAAPVQTLFEEVSTLKLAIEAPFSRLIIDRVGESTYHPGTVRYTDDTGREIMLPVEIRTRGKTRRRKETCAFPPMRLRFAEGDVSESIFAGQRAIKLVTHCRDTDSYDQLVLQEYLAYRIYNVLTEYSHGVRLAEITYMHTGGAHVATRLGIFLERWEAVADRNEVIAAKVDGGVNIDMLNPAAANRVAVFQYLIGNEDWSILWPESKEDCCHNSKPLYSPEGFVIPLPYDFDFAGIVDAPYALAKAPNREVRNRRYGGLCQPQSSGLDETLATFREHRQAIYALYRDQLEMRERPRASTLRYLDRFYAVINDPQQVERRMIRRCKKK